MKYSLVLGLCGVFLAPLSASAVGISFGGRVAAVVPCSGGMLHVTILGAHFFPVPEFYIWTPATITKSYGPPLVIGQQVLGVADFPLICFLGDGGFFSSPIHLYGLRMQSVGTSLPVPFIGV